MPAGRKKPRRRRHKPVTRSGPGQQVKVKHKGETTQWILQRLGELKLPRAVCFGGHRLIDEGNTIPFIARYRKEATNAMDDQALRQLADRLEYLRGLEKCKGEVAATI